MDARADRRYALAAAALSVGLAAPIAYLVQRLHAMGVGGEHALLVIRENHVAFYWRCAASLWWGGVVGIAAYASTRGARHRAESLTATFSRSTILVSLGLILIFWWFP